MVIASFLRLIFYGSFLNKDFVFDAKMAIFNYFMNKIEGIRHFFVKIYYLFKKK